MPETNETAPRTARSPEGRPSLLVDPRGLTRAASGFVTPSLLTADERSEWLGKITQAERDGTYLEVPLQAEVYWDALNANFWRYAPDDFEAVPERAQAEIASGLPPQARVDHGRRTGAVIGRLTSAELIDADPRGLRVEMILTEPDAQRRFIRGELDRFSIGAGMASSHCSQCGPELGPAEPGWWSYFECGHHRGQVLGDGETVVEAWLQGGTLDEVSFVTDPAVDNTRVLSRDANTEGSAMAEREEYEARIAALEAEKAEMQARVDEQAAQAAEQNEALFVAIFEGAYGVKVLETDRVVCRAYYDTQGAEALRSYLESKAPVAGVSQQTIGSNGGAPAPTKPEASREEKGLVLASEAYRLGMLTKRPTAERLAECQGFSRARFH